MSKRGTWLIVAASLMVLGMVMMVLAAHSVNWDFEGYATTVYNGVDSEFDSISIGTDTADIEFLPSDNGACRVISYGSEKVRHEVSVVDGALIVSVVDEREWYEHISIGFRTPRLTIYLPKSEYDLLVIREHTGDVEMPKDFTFGRVDIMVSTGDVRWSAAVTDSAVIKTTTGDICVEDATVESLDLKVSTGDVYLNDVWCQGLTSSGNTGDISLKNVTVEGRLWIKRSTGDVKFKGSSAGEAIVDTSTGKITGSVSE